MGTALASIHDGSGPIPWPDTPEAAQLRSWIEPLWSDGTAAWIANVHTEMFVVACGEVVLPLSVGSARGDSYVVSPYSHYVSYALDETRELGGLLRWGSRLLALPLTGICRLGRFDQVVMVNNWLLSTNLYPSLDEPTVRAILEAVRARWPQHAVVFRSVDLGLRAELHGWLEEAGARMVFGRRIHIVRDSVVATKRSNNRKDAKLARRSPVRPTDAVRPAEAAALYRKLYIDKYSTFNPLFSPELIERARESGMWRVQGWAESGELAAVIGTWSFNGVLTTPLLGYDTDRPIADGLYRLACRGILDRALALGVVANRSAGAASFKQARGAESVLEFNAVFDSHLGPLRRLPWWGIQTALDRWVVPMILRENL